MPSAKRARQRAGRNARMAELRRAQKRRRRYWQAGVVAVVVIVALILAYVTSSGSNTKASGAPAPAGLQVHQAPPVSAACNARPSPVSSPTTTIPAKGDAVSIVPAPATVPFPKLDGSSPRYTKFSKAPPFCININKSYTATIDTDLGKITVKLYPKYAPVTVNSFVFLAGYHFFDGVPFHRVIQQFVDQTGDPTGTGSGGPGYEFKDELPKSTAAYVNGAVAMANSGPNTNGSQFFLVVGNGGSGLSKNYTVFGQVTNGMDVMDRINKDGGPVTQTSGIPKVLHKVVKVTISES